MRGGKGDLWDGGIRVPLIVAWKGHAAAGRTIDVPISSMDATFTALELAGADGKEHLDGSSLLGLITGKSDAAPHETLFWRVGKQNALRHGQWKLIRNNETAWKLYDLAADIGETTDLTAKEPLRVKELNALWDQWNAGQVQPLWK